MKSIAFFNALLVCVCSLAVPRQTLAEKPEWNIRIEMQVVAVPAAIGVPLVGDLMDEAKIEAAYAKIQELLSQGVATLIGWPIVTTKSQQRAVVEAVHEVRYASEYQPPTVSFTPSIGAGEEAKATARLDLTQFEAVPSNFETRNVGVTLEVETVLSEDAKLIHLNLVPIHTRLKGYTKITIDRPTKSGKVTVEQPEFDTMKVTTSLTMRNGQRILLGVYPTDVPPKHLEFFILKVEAKKVE